MSAQRIRTKHGWIVLATYSSEAAAIRAAYELSCIVEAAYMPQPPPHSVQPQTDPTLPGPPIDPPERPQSAGELLAERQHAQAEQEDDETCSGGVCLAQTEV